MVPENKQNRRYKQINFQMAFKIIAVLHNTLLATFIKLLETVSKCLFRNRSQNRCHTLLDCRRKQVLLRMAIILKAIKLIYLYLLFCLFSGTVPLPNILDTPHIYDISRLGVKTGTPEVLHITTVMGFLTL
jgi:hypothetical protein